MLDGGQMMHDDNITLRLILSQAKLLYEIRKNANKSITWADYEYFKQKLHSEFLFGYEKQLADILGL